jgi:hypothetical protein
MKLITLEISRFGAAKYSSNNHLLLLLATKSYPLGILWQKCLFFQSNSILSQPPANLGDEEAKEGSEQISENGQQEADWG